MKTVVCPVCGVEVEVPANAKDGDVITCPVCYARLKLVGDGKGGWNFTVV